MVLVVKNPPAHAKDFRDVGLILKLGRSPAGGNGNPLQYCCLGNPMNIGAWQAIVHGVAKSWTQRLFPCLPVELLKNRFPELLQA